MLVLGIIGGIASGKSLVSQELARLGAEVIEADRIGHEVLLDPAVIASARERWGPGVVDDEGQLRRSVLAAIVFGPEAQAPAERNYLEQLTHPRISARIRDKISELATRGDVDVVVLDAALLVEAGWHEYCDHIVFVDAPREARLARARQRGWSEVQFSAREAAQLPLPDKRAFAQTVIDNSGSMESALAQVRALWNTLLVNDAQG
jgi:dephospho-CoA kinase